MNPIFSHDGEEPAGALDPERVRHRRPGLQLAGDEPEADHAQQRAARPRPRDPIPAPGRRTSVREQQRQRDRHQRGEPEVPDELAEPAGELEDQQRVAVRRALKVAVGEAAKQEDDRDHADDPGDGVVGPERDQDAGEQRIADRDDPGDQLRRRAAAQRDRDHHHACEREAAQEQHDPESGDHRAPTILSAPVSGCKHRYGGATVPPALEISLLGPPRVRRDGEPVAFDTRKATALLAHLALADRPRSREALCELLWPDQDPEHARGALRRTLSALRKSVGEQWIDAASDSVALRDGAQLDVGRFRELAADGQLARAVEVFRGDLLEGFAVRDCPAFDAWYVAEADALQRELGAVLGRLVRALADGHEYGPAIRHARRWLALDALHEPAHRELIRLYALDGDRASALAQYRECVRTLSQELGVGPVDETAALFEQVSEGTLVAAVPKPPVPAPVAAPPAELPLAGRAAELAALVAAHASAVPDGRVAVIEGEAGIGKTRLARELIAEVDGLVLCARCHEDEAGLPYGPVIELLAEAHRTGTLAAAVPAQRLADAAVLLPELATTPSALDGPAAKARLLEGVAAVLAVATLVFVDDVHAADEATLDVLAYTARRLRDRPLLLLLAWRSDGVPLGHRLRRLTSELSATVVTLGRLDEQQVGLIVGSVDPELARRVYAESEGLPVFVAEYLATLGDPVDGPALERSRRGARRGARSNRPSAARDRGGDRPLLQLRGREIGEWARRRRGHGRPRRARPARPRARARRRRADLRLHTRQAARVRVRADRPCAPPAAAPAGGRGLPADREGCRDRGASSPARG